MVTRLIVPPCRGGKAFLHRFALRGLERGIVTNSGCGTDGQETSRQSVVQSPPIFVARPAVRVGSAFTPWKVSRGCTTTNQEHYENKERGLHLEQHPEHVDSPEQPQQVVKDHCGPSFIYVASLCLGINKPIQTSHSMLRWRAAHRHAGSMGSTF